MFLSLIFPEIIIHAQEPDWQPLTREIIVNNDDSLVRAHILIQPVKVNTSDNLMYYWYNQQTINKNMGGYAGELLHGEYLVYDHNKNLITKGSYAYGLKDGIWKYWNANGTLRFSIEYKNGLKDGNSITYKTDGTIDIIRKYKKGKLLPDNLDKKMKIWRSGEKESENDKTDSLKIDSIKKE